MTFCRSLIFQERLSSLEITGEIFVKDLVIRIQKILAMNKTYVTSSYSSKKEEDEKMNR